MLITIPQAAIFGPQKRSDGMLDALNYQPINQKLVVLGFLSTKKSRETVRRKDEASRSADPHHSAKPGICRDAELSSQSEWLHLSTNQRRSPVPTNQVRPPKSRNISFIPSTFVVPYFYIFSSEYVIFKRPRSFSPRLFGRALLQTLLFLSLNLLADSMEAR